MKRGSEFLGKEGNITNYAKSINPLKETPEWKVNPKWKASLYFPLNNFV